MRSLVDGLSDALGPFARGRVLLEATTLGFAEIILGCKALRHLGHDSFDIVSSGKNPITWILPCQYYPREMKFTYNNRVVTF